MASTSDIRKGLCIKFNNDIFKIIDFLHVKPGKGPAFVRTKLKNVKPKNLKLGSEKQETIKFSKALKNIKILNNLPIK